MGRAAFMVGLVALLATSVAWAAGNRRPSDAVRGNELYGRHCAACHGAFGRGDGPAAQDLVKPVPDLAGRFTSDQVDEAVELVLEGRGAMPGFEASFDQHDARRVLRRLASMASSPIPVQPPSTPTGADPGSPRGGGGDEPPPSLKLKRPLPGIRIPPDGVPLETTEPATPEAE